LSFILCKGELQMEEWIKEPFYTVPPEVIVEIPAVGNYPPTTKQIAETLMHENTRELLEYPPGFLNGAGGSGALTTQQFRDSIVGYAKWLTTSPYAVYTCVDFDPVVRGNWHADKVIATLKRIAAVAWMSSETGSVYDVWLRQVGS
jgi:hypothetical protein